MTHLVGFMRSYTVSRDFKHIWATHNFRLPLHIRGHRTRGRCNEHALGHRNWNWCPVSDRVKTSLRGERMKTDLKHAEVEVGYSLESFLPPSLLNLSNPQTEIPKIAKDPGRISQIEQTVG